MAPGDSRGFLIQAPTASGRDGLQVLGRPEIYADASSTALSVLAAGQSRPITVILASAADEAVPARRAQMQALTRRVQQRLTQDPEDNVIVVGVGAQAVAGLIDLTVRESLTAGLSRTALPGDHVLVSPALLREFRRSQVEFLPQPNSDEPAQTLQLQP
jgi:hypothetical protein